MGINFWHIAIFAVVAILVLGGGRFSSMMGDVAKGIKNFKKGMAEEDGTSAPTTRIEGRPAAPTIDGEPISTGDRQI